MTLNISDQYMTQRQSNLQLPAPKYTRELLAKYARTVSSASTCAVTDKPDSTLVLQ
jgi:dihydroxy-acid dehydratase